MHQNRAFPEAVFDPEQACEWQRIRSLWGPRLSYPSLGASSTPATDIVYFGVKARIFGSEKIGRRIIEIPEDEAIVLNRDPRSGFIAYVPKGSIAKGKVLVTTGGKGKTIPCAICHGPTLQGLGEVPPIAGRQANYVVRQLWSIQNGERSGNSAALMQAVVAKLSVDDMLAIAAYTASRAP